MPKPIDMGKQRNPGNTPMTPSHSHFACLQVNVGAMELLKIGHCSRKYFQGVEKGAYYA
jgi:hypothetical protein